MLEAVGHPHAVNPDKELRRIAGDRGWPVLRLRPARHAAQPDAAARPKPTLAALAVGGVAAVGGALWMQRAGGDGPAPDPAARGESQAL